METAINYCVTKRNGEIVFNTTFKEHFLRWLKDTKEFDSLVFDVIDFGNLKGLKFNLCTIKRLTGCTLSSSEFYNSYIESADIITIQSSQFYNTTITFTAISFLTHCIFDGCSLKFNNIRAGITQIVKSFITKSRMTGELPGSYLSSSIFQDSELRDLNLIGAQLPPANTLLNNNWYTHNKDLIQDLMLWDAFNHPNLESFHAWAKNGDCPFLDNRNLGFKRAANFDQDREIWLDAKSHRVKKPTTILKQLFDENEIKFFQTTKPRKKYGY